MPADNAVSTPRRWHLVVPVKRLERAKSRLGGLDPQDRQRLALAFATDVVHVALHCTAVARLLVVTGDDLVAAAAGALGADVIADPGTGGLNAAIRHGVTALRAAEPAADVACLTADLPAVTAEALAQALARVPNGARAFVPDADGEGTSLLAAAAPAELDPHYGAHSRRLHLTSGAFELDAPECLRRDVDTAGHLERAVRLGVGPATARLLAEHGSASVRPAGR